MAHEGQCFGQNCLRYEIEETELLCAAPTKTNGSGSSGFLRSKARCPAYAYDALTYMYDCPIWQASAIRKFTGKERDSESGLDNFKARYDSSSLGRFISPDPANYGAIDESPQTWNAYSYVATIPLNATDPDGLDCVYTQGFSQTGEVTVERGNCTQKGGTYVDGTIDTKSLTYDQKTNQLGYTFSNAEEQTWRCWNNFPWTVRPTRTPTVAN